MQKQNHRQNLAMCVHRSDFSVRVSSATSPQRRSYRLNKNHEYYLNTDGKDEYELMDLRTVE